MESVREMEGYEKKNRKKGRGGRARGGGIEKAKKEGWNNHGGLNAQARYDCILGGPTCQGTTDWPKVKNCDKMPY